MRVDGWSDDQGRVLMAESATRNPDWTRDELILALDLYKQSGGNPAKNGKEVVELSETLNALGSDLVGRTDVFRNANGVYMKIMNLRRWDDAYSSLGKSGLKGGSRLEKEVWDHFANDQELLRQTAAAIRSQLGSVPEEDEALEEDAEEGAEEGRILARVHKRRERSRKIANKKKKQVLEEQGRLCCEACGFDFGVVYGERGEGFIEVHHTVPLHTLTAGKKTLLKDLALLCANCHRMIHSRSAWLTVDELKVLVQSSSVSKFEKRGG
jgi:5-methylcytosine-specific restriction protein A